MFIRYPKIQRLDKEENEGLLDRDNLVVQEKMDGANTSIWFKEGKLHMASRGREITEGFNGFVDYVNEHAGIKKLLQDLPQLHLFGEWLVRHTLTYNEMSLRKFYLFDVLDTSKVKNKDDDELDFTDCFLDLDAVQLLSEKYDISFPQIFARGKVTEEEIREFVGKTEHGELGEGVVIKSAGFVNKFGNHSYGKIVTQKFKESNSLVFGGNNKHSDTYWEMYIVNKYCTMPRVEKIMNKIQPTIDEKLDKKHTSRVASTCYNDLLTEEIWEIAKKVGTINFKQLKRLCGKKFIQVFHDILDNNLSVADKEEE